MPKNLKKISKTALMVAVLALLLGGTTFSILSPNFVQAQDDSLWVKIQDEMLPMTEQAGLGTAEPSPMIAKIIKVVLGFLGTVAVVLIIYAGFLWMTAGGNEEQIKKARGLLINAVIGLIIILAAYGIAYFAIERLIKATSE